MHLADYIVSNSLHINSRCLRYLADSHGRLQDEPDDLLELSVDAQPVLAENTLIRDARRLLSMWRSVIADEDLADERMLLHYDRLHDVVQDLQSSMAPLRLGLRLASLAAEEEDAQNLLTVVRALPRRPRIAWGDLNEEFTRDSAMWRDVELFRHLSDKQLVGGFARQYRKAVKPLGKLNEELQEPTEARRALTNRLRKVGDRSQLVAHQLELLRPGLSDKLKRQHWHLDKFADAYRTLASLLELRLLIDERVAMPRPTRLDKQVARDSQAYLDGQVLKLRKRMQRLMDPAFAVKPKRYDVWIAGALSKLGLVDVTLLSSRRQAAAVDTTLPLDA